MLWSEFCCLRGYANKYMDPYIGDYGPSADENRFWPALGNHDWDTGTVQPYLDYFTLPGNGRYYDLEKGPVHFFGQSEN